MTQLLVWKDRLREIYRRNHKIFIPILRFVSAFAVFLLINQQIGYEGRLLKMPVVLGLSLFSAAVPSAVIVFLAAVVTLVHIFAASRLLALIFALVILVLYFLLARYAPRYGWVVLLVPVLYHFHLPYAAPLLLGLIGTPVSVLAIACGVVVHYLFLLIQETAVMASGSMGMEDSLYIYTYVLKTLVNNRQMLFAIAVFSVVLILTWVIRRMKITHAYEIALVSGTVTMILLFIMSNLLLGKSDQLLFMILGCIGSGIIVYVVQFFRFVLDYGTIENVQFEDDDYYYYVKAVPKVRVTTPEMSVKTFAVGDASLRQEEDEPEEEIGEEYYGTEEDYEEDRTIRR